MSYGPRMSIWCKEEFSLIHAVINYVFQLRKTWILIDMNLGWNVIDFPNQYPKSCQISPFIFLSNKWMVSSCHNLMRLESQSQIKLLNCRSKCITASSLSLIENNLQTMTTQWAVFKSWPETDQQTVRSNKLNCQSLSQHKHMMGNLPPVADRNPSSLWENQYCFEM